jgi:hypothetical protein
VLLAGTVLVAGDEGYSWIVGSAHTAAAFLDRLAC